MTWLAVGTAAVAVVGGVISSEGQKSAAKKQAKALKKGQAQSEATQMEMYQLSQEANAPWRQSGAQALSALNAIYGLNTVQQPPQEGIDNAQQQPPSGYGDGAYAQPMQPSMQPPQMGGYGGGYGGGSIGGVIQQAQSGRQPPQIIPAEHARLRQAVIPPAVAPF